MNEKDFLTAEEARERLKISRWKMAKLLKSGEIPSQKSGWDGRIKVIRRIDLEAWIELHGPRVRYEKADSEGIANGRAAA